MLKSLNNHIEFKDVTKENLTDGHLDINSVREGSIVIAPVKVKGAGIYLGDVHSIQGAGELAGHTIDVTATVRVRVTLLKAVSVPSPVIIPNIQDVNFRFRPFTDEEMKNISNIAGEWHLDQPENQYPMQFTGSGNGMNEAIDNAIKNVSMFLNISEDEVKNRATISGEVGIGRTSGFSYLTIALPESIFKETGLAEYINRN